MRRLHLLSGPRCHRRIQTLCRCARIGHTQCSRFKSHFTILRPRLLSINRKGQRPSGGSSLHIDRSTVIVRNLDIFISTGNRRIHGRLYITDYHGMVLPLRNLQFCAKCRIVKCRRNLADTAAHTVHDLSVLIRRRGIVSILRRKRMHAFISRQSLTRHQHMTIHLGRSHLKVLGTCGSAAAEIRGKSSQHILNPGKILLGNLRFRHRHRRLHGNRFRIRIRQRLVQCFPGRLRIHHDTGRSRSNHKFTVLSGNGSILRLSRQIPALLRKKRADQILIHRQFKRNMNRFLLQILQRHIPLNQISLSSIPSRFLHCFRIHPCKTKLPCRRIRSLFLDLNHNLTFCHACHTGLNLLPRLLAGQSAQTDITDINAFRQSSFLRISRHRHQHRCRCRQHRAKPYVTFFHNCSSNNSYINAASTTGTTMATTIIIAITATTAFVFLSFVFIIITFTPLYSCLSPDSSIL